MFIRDETPVSLTDAKITGEGYLVADAYVARGNNIQTYLARELGLTDRAPTDKVRVFRPADEVFALDSLKTIVGRPITLDHPPEDVTADNWAKYAKGDVGSDIMRDGDRVRLSLKVMDAAAVRSMKTDRQQFSLGYKAEIFMEDGEFEGEPYDAVARGYKYNHLAACRVARGGSDLRIVDERSPQPGENKMKTIMVDGIPVADVSPAAEAVIDRLTNQLKDSATSLTALQTANGELTAQVGVKDGEIAALKKSVEDAALTPEKLDIAVQARALIVDTAKKVIGDSFDPKGKTDGDIKRAVVSKHLDAATVAGMNDDGISGAFRIFADAAVKAKDASEDTLRSVVLMGDGRADVDDLVAARDKARAAHLQRMGDAHLGATSDTEH